MAIYHSTIRSETKLIGDIEIGRYSYAYKESWSQGNYPHGHGRRVRLAESHGEDAAYRNRHVRHFIVADDFATACQDGYSVFEIDHAPSVSISQMKNALVIGYLRKEGGRFVLHRTPQRLV